MTAPSAAAPAADSEFRELVERIRRRDVTAETRLYDHFGPRVQYLAWRELRPAACADDVRSETMLRVLQAVRDGRLRSAAALPAFVLQTARHVIHEFRRQDRRFVALPDGAHEPEAPPVDLVDTAAVQALAVAIERLGTRDRAFLRMHYYDDLSRQEIASRLGIHEDRVRLIKSRALHRFRDAYQEIVGK